MSLKERTKDYTDHVTPRMVDDEISEILILLKRLEERLERLEAKSGKAHPHWLDMGR